MPDEDRVFDVTKPNRVNPSATSKPVIVGHQPTMSDPMVRGDTQPTRIQVDDGSAAPAKAFEAPGLFSDSNSGSTWDGASAPDPASQPEPATIYHPAEPTQPPTDNTQPIQE